MIAAEILEEFQQAGELGRREWMPHEGYRILLRASALGPRPRARRKVDAPRARERFEIECCVVVGFSVDGVRYEMREGNPFPIRIGAVR